MSVPRHAATVRFAEGPTTPTLLRFTCLAMMMVMRGAAVR
jgi:hypothetical protein